ncbi:MAG: creatininase family protein, partial [Rhodospirillales bacterium]|nr:creatininase family protein [Rhodospirillales bacterium]
MPHAIARLRAPEVAARLAAGAALILPMGSTETHGPAAPMGDYLLAEAIAMQAARALAAQGDDALVAPGIAFGGEDFFAGVPGAIALSPATLTALTLECLEALHRGAPGARLLVVNGHGGNIAAIDTAQRAMRARHGVVLPA